MASIEAERPATHRGGAGAPVYAYGIVHATTRPPARSGVLGAAVDVVPSGGVAALVSRLDTTRVRAKRRDLLAHSDVLQDAHAAGVVLPLRFGTLFDSEDELRARLLEPRRDELQALLSRFHGLGELRLRARYHDQETVLADVVRDDAEIARLRRGGGSQAELVRLGELVAKRYAARRAADADAIVGALRGHAVDTRVDEPDDELAIVKASFLVRERDRRSFDEQLDSVALRLRHLVHFTCTGPLPAHSFVALDGGGA